MRKYVNRVATIKINLKDCGKRIDVGEVFKIAVLSNKSSWIAWGDKDTCKFTAEQTAKIFEYSAECVEPKLDIDVEAIKENPAKYGETTSVPMLVKTLTILDRKYHDEGTPLVSDDAYDTLVECLKEKDPNNKYLKKHGYAPTVKAPRRVALPYPMPSLQKIKIGARKQGNITEWTVDHPKPYLVSPKLDGTSLLLVYKGGLPPKLYTKGNGTIAQDISDHVKNLKIPQILAKGCVLRGEVIMKKKVFEESFKGQFSDPRSMGSGMINKLGDAPHLKRFDVVIHEVMEPNLKPSKQIEFAKTNGFSVVDAMPVNKDISNDILMDILKTIKKSIHYKIDGIVIKQDKLGLKNEDAIAFKIDNIEEAPIATVVKVEWNVTRYNVMFPKIIVEPVMIDGFNVTKASGKNAKFILDNKIGIGTKLKLLRAGDVIPEVAEVVHSTKPMLPEGTSFKWDGDNYVLLDKKDDKVLARKIEHFFATLGIDGVGPGIAKKLVAAGLDSIEKIVKASVQDLLKMEGVQAATANKIHSGLRAALASATFARLGDASGIFSRSIGERRLDAVITAIPNILARAYDTKESLVSSITDIHGFEEKTATLVADGMPKFKEFITTLGVTFKKVKKGTSMENEVVAFTGFRNADLVKRIEEQGGKYIDGITKQTTILVMKDANSESSKTMKAKQNGVQVMTVDQMVARL